MDTVSITEIYSAQGGKKMRIQSSLAKGTFADKRNTQAEEARMKAYNDGFMRLLKKAESDVDSKDRKDGAR